MAMNDNAPLDHLLPLKEVIAISGLGKTMIYRLMREGKFPAQHKPGGSASRWSENEVRAWREALDDARRARAA